MLLVGEIFNSISGEVGLFPQGIPCTFLRLAGCNYQCGYCDTKNYISSKSGILMPVPVVAERVKSKGLTNIVVTGGEPLLQKHYLIPLLENLYRNRNVKISIETNGSIEIPELPKMRNRIGWVIDVKMPRSGHYDPMWVKKLPEDLNSNDWFKFVMCDDEDYKKAVECYRLIKDLGFKSRIAFSPVFPHCNTAILFDKMIKDSLHDVVMNIQIHKFIELP